MRKHKSTLTTAFFFLALVLAVFSTPIIYIALGIGSFGPTRTVQTTVVSKHIDYSGQDEDRTSNYMVNTKDGTFEVANGLFLGVWNSDEIYGNLVEGQVYTLTTKGNRVVGMFFQEYPYIVSYEKSGK
jgi:hypothetical protein